MKIIFCGCCGNDIGLDDYDYARFCKGEAIYCEECCEDYKNNRSRTNKF